MTTRDKIRNSALALFDEKGVEATTVADIRAHSEVSNGSFFHAFKNRDALCADLYLSALQGYHQAIIAALDEKPGIEEEISGFIQAHINWVIEHETQARFLFLHAKSEWLDHIRAAQQEENTLFGESIEKWCKLRITSGNLVDMPSPVVLAQLIGPAQIYCRGWLSGRKDADPRDNLGNLVICAVRAVALQT